MKKFGLIGRPLGHSASASYFADKFATHSIDAQYARNIKEYKKLQKYRGSTTYNDGYERYRNARIKELERIIQKEEKAVQNLNKKIEVIDAKLQSEQSK